ncbi:hypothetical protein AAFF_G00208410 [Aldrovandia affinis]|uniref:Uncharacterized protein n=1 Tax=Aldrovandia affinis TaxID=143900 RepID=A0AAD7RH85_9TELE|nr:hypothetical protein AAFF_G00208410 [Aldrovandia affinis]
MLGKLTSAISDEMHCFSTDICRDNTLTLLVGSHVSDSRSEAAARARRGRTRCPSLDNRGMSGLKEAGR